MKIKLNLSFIVLLLMLTNFCLGQSAEVLYDESKIPAYTLPDPLVMQNGQKVETAEQWINQRRPELIKLFEEYVYGVKPKKQVKYLFEETKVVPDFLEGRATLKEINLDFADAPLDRPISLLLIIPNGNDGPVPVFAGLNFGGNQTVHTSNEITLAKVWNGNIGELSIADENTRGSGATRWPVERIIDRGYAIITAYYGDIDPDFDDGFKNGIHPLFDESRNESSWGSMSAWAWGLSRMLDYAEMDEALDQRKVIVIGHSRLGKTALWAGALDERFAAIISNDSGCGGAALSRREYGETIKSITTIFPHWFCKRLSEYGSKVNKLPVDQHELIALMAPRPVYIASAEDDQWADPHGEFLSAVYAEPVYKLFGLKGLPVQEMPVVNRPVYNRIGYHIRTGKHDITPYDWEQYLDFVDINLNR